MKNKKKLLITALLSLTVITAAISTATTLASFIALAKVGPDVASKGERGTLKTIYLNANMWTAYDPTFVMRRYSTTTNDKVDVPVSKVIHPTIDGVTFTLYAFQYDTSDTTHDAFKFMRIDGGNTIETPSDRYVIDKFNEPATQFSLYPTRLENGNIDTNKYQAKHVHFSVGDSLKVHDIIDTGNWYRNEHNGTNHIVDVSPDYNIKIIRSGTYTVNFYIQHGQNDHVEFINELWNETQGITFSDSYNYYCVQSWDNDTVKGNSLTYTKGNQKPWVFGFNGDQTITSATKYTTVSFLVDKDAGYGNSIYVRGAFNSWTSSTDYRLNYSGGRWIGELELPEGNGFKLYIDKTEDPSGEGQYEGGNDRTVTSNMAVTNWQ